MFVRFVIQENNEDSGRRQGVFHAIRNLRDDGLLEMHEKTFADELMGWFNANLKEPESFTRSSKPHAKNVAISWFKDTAHQHISRMHIIKHLLHEHGIVVLMLRTERPGYVVYEDEFQVVAEPFKETIT